MPQHEDAGLGLEAEASEEALAKEKERLFHWYGATLNARYWLGLAAVDANEAAQFLSGELPNTDSATWLESTSWVDHSGGAPLMAPQHRRQLLRGFQDVGGKRQIVEWLRIAQARFWRYDPWIDLYLEAAKDRAERIQQSIKQSARNLTEAETAAADAIDRLHAVKAEIKEWRRRATPTATDFKHQQDALERLDAEERMLDTAVKHLRGDFAEVDDVGLLQAVLDSAEAPPQGDSTREAPFASANERPPTVPETRKAAILRALVDLGYDPLKLPPAPREGGAKAAVRLRLGNKGIWANSQGFKKAWGDLRHDEKIKDA